MVLPFLLCPNLSATVLNSNPLYFLFNYDCFIFFSFPPNVEPPLHATGIPISLRFHQLPLWGIWKPDVEIWFKPRWPHVNEGAGEEITLSNQHSSPFAGLSWPSWTCWSLFLYHLGWKVETSGELLPSCINKHGYRQRPNISLHLHAMRTR